MILGTLFLLINLVEQRSELPGQNKNISESLKDLNRYDETGVYSYGFPFVYFTEKRESVVVNTYPWREAKNGMTSNMPCSHIEIRVTETTMKNAALHQNLWVATIFVGTLAILCELVIWRRRTWIAAQQLMESQEIYASGDSIATADDRGNSASRA